MQSATDETPAIHRRKTTPTRTVLTLTDRATLGLFFIQRYRFLTIDQFARVADLNRNTASNQLRLLELAGFLGHFGNTGLTGHGKTPKAYFLTRKGWELLLREGDIPAELLGSHKEQIPPDLVVKFQPIDIVDIIL